MKYVFEHFDKINIRNDVFGWFFEDTGEFRPLDDQQMRDLYEAGKATVTNLIATRKAYKKNTEDTIAKYVAAMANRTEEEIAEQRAEARAAFGPGEKVVNMLTGETWTT